MMDRRDFFCALAASVVAAKMPLPIGFPEDPFGQTSTIAWKYWHTGAVLNENWVRSLVVKTDKSEYFDEWLMLEHAPAV